MSTVRFLLRLPPWLHQRLTARAAAHALSLNEYCVRALAGPEPLTVAHPGALAVRSRASAVAGERLLGIVLHGSWARGQARAASDVDVLVVVARGLTLARSLYRAWDAEPLSWEGRPVDAHFVHLPDAAERAGAVWCEAAIEGVVLHDSDGRIDQTLRRIRRAIAEGRLVRKQVHGQPYWTTAA